MITKGARLSYNRVQSMNTANKKKKYNHPGTAKHDHLLWSIMEEWFKSFSEFDFFFILGKKTYSICVEV